MEQNFRDVSAQLLTIKQMLEEAHEREVANARGSFPGPQVSGVRDTSTRGSSPGPQVSGVHDTSTRGSFPGPQVSGVRDTSISVKPGVPKFIDLVSSARDASTSVKPVPFNSMETPRPPEEVPAMLPFLPNEDEIEVWQDKGAVSLEDEKTAEDLILEGVSANATELPNAVSENSRLTLSGSQDSVNSSRTSGRRVTIPAIVKDVTDKFEKNSAPPASEKIGAALWKRGFDLASKVADVAAHFDRKLHEAQVEDPFNLLDVWCLDDQQIVRIRAKRNLVHRSTDARQTVAIGDGADNCDDDDEVLTAPSRGNSLFFAGGSVHTTLNGFECIHPQSRTRQCWDMASLFLFAYDVIFIPMAVFDLPNTLFFNLFDYVGAVYWTLDIGFSFMTGIYMNGHLVRKPSLVARRYMRTWMPFDLIIVLADWASLVADDVGLFGLARALRGGRFLRILRAFRFLRLLRLVKAHRLLMDLQAKVSSPAVVLSLSISKLLLVALIMCHSLACLWYALGTASLDGWVYVEDIKHESVTERYVLCFQNGIARLHPSNMLDNMKLKTTSERMLAIVATMVALVFSSLFISCITTTMGDLSRLRSRKLRNLIVLNEYISQHQISTQLARQARIWLEKENSEELKAHLDADLLEVLPVDLMTEFRVEAWSPVLLRHPLFNMIHVKHPRTESTICYQTLSEMHHYKGTQVFTTGDLCTHMLFTISGDNYYKAGKDYQAWLKLQQSPCLRDSGNRKYSISTTAQNIEKSDVGPGLWLCEAVIYTHWQYCGDLKACTDVSLLAISAEEVAAVARKHEQAFVDISIYAQCFLEELNRFKGKLSDLPNLVHVSEEDFRTMSSQSILPSDF